MGEETRKKDIGRDMLLQSLLPLSIYSLRKAVEGQSRRHEPRDELVKGGVLGDVQAPFCG